MYDPFLLVMEFEFWRDVMLKKIAPLIFTHLSAFPHKMFFFFISLTLF